ncbi:MAG: 16S rRNA (cytidine(1402)-2'-O)-methyltransferase [Gammaproteobacteria bacterium]|nr:MAG: 16S rRNA (cytidine(1402)-2'-O)-methyltransferase [Gammaproteobacteria bacterium]RKZ71897.1 MAG: 16S rRNA (cytidine(1402)-2'-O)-methyltransferase [Gammaproteobacteria bacterium]
MIKGALYIVATPIGNLEDLSPRAKMVLENVDLIVAEDTRHSKPMLNQFGIETKIRAYHDHNERSQAPVLIEQLQAGASIALISDAGTPLICDPGYHLLLAAHNEKIKVIPIPGPSALISALSAAGFSSEKFIFEGYLPAKQTARRQRLQELKNENRTLVFYETPHRILASIEDVIICFGSERQAVVAKEITKLHENIQRGTLVELLDWLHSDKDLTKGEFVVVIQGDKTNQFDTQEASRILKILLADHSVKQAAKLTSEIMQGNRNDIYKLAMDLKEKE